MQETVITTHRLIGTKSVGRTVSFACNKIWINILFFGTALFDRFGEDVALQATANLYHVSIITLAVSLLCCAILHTRIVPLLERGWFEYVGPAISGIGIVLLMSAATPQDILFTAGSILTGCGSSVTLLSIGRRFAMANSLQCAAEVLSAYILGSALSVGIVHLPSNAITLIAIALPFLAIAVLHSAFPIRFLDDCFENQNTPPSGEYLTAQLVTRFIVCAAGFGIIAGIMHEFCSPSVIGNFNWAFHLITACGLIAITVPLSISYARGVFSPIRSLYRLTTLLCTASFVIVPLFESDYSILYVAATIGYTLFEILTWVILSEIAHRFQYTSVQVFGFGRALVLLVGVIAGYIIAAPFSESILANMFLAVLAIAIVLIAILRMYVLTEHDLALFEQDLSDAAEKVLSQSTPIKSGRLTPTTSSDDAHPAYSVSLKVPFQKKCIIIGEYYGLTRREIDVFRLLAAGRNSTRIQEELSISPGTVNTHSRHIFQKLGVHRQQEIIDLLEQADLDQMQIEIGHRSAKR